MRSSKRKTGLGIGGIFVVMISIVVGRYFGNALVANYFDAPEHHSFPMSASAAAVVKDDPTIHKFFKKQLAPTSFAGSFQVAYPSKKDFRIAAKVSSTDLQKTANQMGALMGATWAYLHKHHAGPTTRITMTVTDGYFNVYDLTAFELEATPTFKDFEAQLKKIADLAR
jgi:hypothetical protein